MLILPFKQILKTINLLSDLMCVFVRQVFNIQDSSMQVCVHICLRALKKRKLVFSGQFENKINYLEKSKMEKFQIAN